MTRREFRALAGTFCQVNVDQVIVKEGRELGVLFDFYLAGCLLQMTIDTLIYLR